MTYDHLKKLKFLDATIKESQRFFTTNPLMGRDCDENTVVGGIPIEKVSLWHVSGIVYYQITGNIARTNLFYMFFRELGCCGA